MKKYTKAQYRIAFYQFNEATTKLSLMTLPEERDLAYRLAKLQTWLQEMRRDLEDLHEINCREILDDKISRFIVDGECELKEDTESKCG